MQPTSFEKVIIRYPREFLLIALFICCFIPAGLLTADLAEWWWGLEGILPNVVLVFIASGIFSALTSFGVYPLCNLLAKRIEVTLRGRLGYILFCLVVALLACSVVPFVLLARVHLSNRYEAAEDSILLYGFLPAMVLCPCLAAAVVLFSRMAFLAGQIGLGRRSLRILPLLGLFWGVALPVLAAWPRFVEDPVEAKVSECHAQIATLEMALAAFAMDTGRYPTSDEGLKALMDRPPGLAGWHGPYLERGVTNDPWGNPYVYTCPGTHGTSSYDLHSFEPDGQDGTEDDINNWPQR